MKSSYLFLADGFEETEALATVDVLRRGGMDVKTVSITGKKQVTGSHEITVIADLLLSEAHIDQPDWLIIPGGMPGATNLAACDELNNLLMRQNARGGHIAAICASPAVVLAPLNILDGREATCYPGMEHLCPRAIMKDELVVTSDNIVTGQGPAAAMPFALTILKEELGAKTAEDTGRGLLFYPREMSFYF